MIKNNVVSIIFHLFLAAVIGGILYLFDQQMNHFFLQETLGIITILTYVLLGLSLKIQKSLFHSMCSVLGVSILSLCLNLADKFFGFVQLGQYFLGFMNSPFYVISRLATRGDIHGEYWFLFMPWCFLSFGLMIKLIISRKFFSRVLKQN